MSLQPFLAPASPAQADEVTSVERVACHRRVSWIGRIEAVPRRRPDVTTPL
ncbi:hypothetical protein [Streptomyces sp. NPDC051211]|uniref:hypothetical protein n=1 Tax=Streptomyces sp. NPDC051211 TaxID=3154643 RepID=UPI00344B2F08